MDPDKLTRRVVVFAETDGCFVDGIEAATGCSVGHCTLRVEDYGKIAATFFDLKTDRAVRIIPKTDVRLRASQYVHGEGRHYYAQLDGYQSMPDEELIDVQHVRLLRDMILYMGTPGSRVICETCHEEIINGRELTVDGVIRCRTCSGDRYYVSEQ